MNAGSVLANPTGVIPAISSLGSADRASSFANAADAARFRDALVGAPPTSSAVVAPVRTNLSAPEAEEAIRRAWTNVTGEAPSSETVSILRAQWAHETASGASMYNYNFAGIKGTGPSGLSTAQRTTEGWGSGARQITDKFRAYTTAEEGATDYVRLLSNKFPEATEAAKNGDPTGFVRGLKSRGYFTGNEEAYSRSIVSLSGVPASENAPADLSTLPTLSGTPFATASAESAGSIRGATAATPGPFVDSLAMADELSRAALRIVVDADRKTSAAEAT